MKIRKPVFSGTWYSDNSQNLSKEIDGYLSKVEYKNLDVKAVIVPHAGYMFSGQTAAYSFKQINKNTKEVFILGTAHRYALRGSCAIDFDYYNSPLGKVKVSDKIKNILTEKNIFNISKADNNEHSIEIEIPFLQRVLDDFEIIPIIVGETDYIEFANILEKYFTDFSTIVGSVDLSHFHPYNDAKKLDGYSINSILNLDANAIKKAEIDSPHAVMSLIELAKRKNWKTKLLDYKNSGDIIVEKNSVVGYSSIIFYKE